MDTNTPAAQPTTAGMIAVVDFTKGPAATVHAGVRHPRGVATYCTGRHMSYAVGTGQAVTCRSCIKKAGNNGVDLGELADPADEAERAHEAQDARF